PCPLSRATQSPTAATNTALGHYSTLQRITKLRTTPDSRPTAEPPEPSTYFDHLSKIAAGKRSQRSSLEPPPREIKTRHCLHCGYDRLGLPDSLPCPECGRPFDFDDRQAICSDLASKPLKLWWQLLTFRP